MLAIWDCLIVGGGVIGLMAARELHRAGMQVAVVERAETGCEASWAGGGILSPLYPWREPDAVLQLAHAGQETYPALVRELQAESGIDPQWTQSGFLILDGNEIENARACAERWKLPLEILTPSEVKKRFPQLGRIDEPAILLPRVAQVRNPRLMKALRESLERQNVPLFENEPVQSLLFTKENAKEKLHGVKTASREIYAERVLVSAGAWSGDLLAPYLDLPVQPVRGQMLLFAAEPGLLPTIVMKDGHYLIPRRDGRIVVGSTMENAGFDKSITDAGMEELSSAAYEILPALQRFALEEQWAGLRPGSPTGIPFMGMTSIGGLYIAAGHFRHGITMAPASASFIADLILSRKPSLDPDLFRLP